VSAVGHRGAKNAGNALFNFDSVLFERKFGQSVELGSLSASRRKKFPVSGQTLFKADIL
jgi:hypothetical protein